MKLENGQISDIVFIISLVTLYSTKMYSYLLFHSLVEIFSIVIAFAIFLISWNSRKFIDNNYFIFIGISYLFIGGIDLLHTFAYQGMQIFIGYDANLPTQLWILARYTESLSLLIAPFYIGRKLKTAPIYFVYAILLSLSLVSMFYWRNFPDCFLEGHGLTTFKILSEYAISIILIFAILNMYKNKNKFDDYIFKLVIASIAITILSELSFTLYTDVYGFPNMIGHYFKIASFYLLYKALIQTNPKKSYSLLFGQMKDAKEKFEGVLEGQTDFIVRYKPGGIITYANDAYLKADGRKREDIIGKNFYDSLDENELKRIISYLETITPDNPIGELEQPFFPPTGNPLWVHWIGKGIFDNKGKIIEYQSVGRDITALKTIEENLEKSEEKYRLVVDSTSDLVFLIDLEGNFTFMNKGIEKHTGYKNHELVGKNIKDFLSPNSYNEAKERIELRLKGATDLPKYEVDILSKNNEFIPFELNTSPIYADEKLTSILIVARDITERKKAEAKIKDLDETIRILNKILRHDILNDLTLLLNIVDSCKGGDEKMKKSIFATIEKSTSLIERMRELEQAVTSGKNLRQCTVLEIVDCVIRNYPEIEFKVKGDCTVLADEAISSVIDNIVRNAIVHGKTKRIDITLTESKELCKIKIADYGIGIPDSIKKRIYEEGASYGEVRSSGIGLYIVKKVIERYGGEITVEDNKPNGAVFVLKLSLKNYNSMY